MLLAEAGSDTRRLLYGPNHNQGMTSPTQTKMVWMHEHMPDGTFRSLLLSD